PRVGSVVIHGIVSEDCNLSRWTPHEHRGCLTMPLARLVAGGDYATFSGLRMVCSPRGPKLDTEACAGPSFASGRRYGSGKSWGEADSRSRVEAIRRCDAGRPSHHRSIVEMAPWAPGDRRVESGASRSLQAWLQSTQCRRTRDGCAIGRPRRSSAVAHQCGNKARPRGAPG